ncbi:MAG: asparagine synthetase B family protein [Bacteroidales bacterium]|nr:asparagine synthetase B family protein [Bacteroidales bacterium]
MRLYLKSYKWHHQGNIHVTGFIRKGEEYLQEKALAELFSKTVTTDKFEETLVSLNGQFSIIVVKENEVWMATDRLRCYPLFYTSVKKEFIISDDCYACLKESALKEICPAARDSFLLAGYVPDNLTLINNIFQAEAGEIVVLNSLVSRRFYHEIFSTPVENKNSESYEKDLHDLLHSVFSSHLKAIKDRFIAIPLSGGYDSRLIAAMSKIYHPENMICYTYGRIDNPEAIKAEEVARRLNIKWLNIEYNNDLINDYLHSNKFKEYYPFASNLSSMFFMQDYFALQYLRERSLVPDNTVFIPGYSGDFLAGSHLSLSMNKTLTENGIAEIILKKHFRYIKSSVSEKEKIKSLISKKIPDIKDNPWKIFENWDMKERQAKFIVNSARTFLFFGYDYIMPFWDRNIMDFFSKISFSLKFNKKLYDTVLKQSIFKELNLNLDNEQYPGVFSRSIQNIKEAVKPFLPYALVTKMTDQKSVIFYDEITRAMREDIGPENIIFPIQSNLFNSYITQWYIYKTQELLKNH